jgi:uncharacterized protein YndB with AHSA1/START domain
MMETMQTLRREVTVACDPAKAFEVFTERIGEWWPLQTHSLSIRRFGAPGTTVAFRDGILLETAPNGDELRWGEVTAWEPPNRLAYTWRIGRDDDLHTDVETTFQAIEEGTLVRVVHTGWEIWAERADEIRADYETGWTPVLAAYAGAT